MADHKPGCEALGGYGHGVGPCTCGADTTTTTPSAAEFALRALVAAGHVSQELVDQALALPGAPQPVAREPLTDGQVDAAAKMLAQCMDYPWEYMPEKGRAAMREHARKVVAAACHHVEKGGS